VSHLVGVENTMPDRPSPAEEPVMPSEESETLIGRIMDHEATAQEFDRFERLAGLAAPLWRTLALRQLDMGLLGDRVRQETDAAARVEVAPVAPRRKLAVTLSGWAAVLLLASWWAIVAGTGDGAAERRPPRIDPVAGSVTQQPLDPDEHLRQYLAADFVTGEYDPVILETERLENGRYRVHFMRRIEVYTDIEAPPDAVMNAPARLRIEPSDQRR